MMERIRVDLGANSYDIVFVWDRLQDIVSELKKVVDTRKIMVVSDDNVLGIYSKAIKKAIGPYFNAQYVSIPPGEQSKSLEQAQILYTKALEFGLDRGSVIVALGGGVVGDLAGFVASTYMRGIPYVQIPTSLLAQVDSSVGGKVAVNHPQAKNVIGNFYQPKLVYIDGSTLSTLPSRQLSSGLAEVIKYGIIYDSQFLDWLEGHIEDIMALNRDAVIHCLKRCCQIKAMVVNQDERETGIRAILNFGHTIGHGVESITGYKEYTHGEAVAVGMIYASKIALNMGMIDRGYYNRIKNIIHHAHLPSIIENIDTKALIKAMVKDKKAVDGKITFVLPTAVGRVGIFHDVDRGEIAKALI
ncbi:MAG: 3-dehydroquinate synthase [Mahellales bacterium]|jgi:3-dehydroquinate synthase